MKIKNHFLFYPVFLFFVLALAACGSSSGSDDDGGEDAQSYTVSGTITLPESVTDEDFYVSIDADHDGSNGNVTSVSGKATGTTFTYSIGNVPAGTYWIYGAVNTSGGQMGPWEEGDYVGDQQITVDGDETVNLTFALYEDEESWQTFFEDNFDGAAGSEPNAANWFQHESSPPPYSLTGSGELEISGDEDEENNGATFIYNSSIDHDRIKISTKFRTELESDFDECDIVLLLNHNADGRYLFITGFENGDEYEYMLIVKQSSENSFEILAFSAGDFFSNNDSCIIEAENDNGYITFRLMNDNSSLINSVQTYDSSFSNGQCGFNGDLKLVEGASSDQSIFFDYFRIETNDDISNDIIQISGTAGADIAAVFDTDGRQADYTAISGVPGPFTLNLSSSAGYLNSPYSIYFIKDADTATESISCLFDGISNLFGFSTGSTLDIDLGLVDVSGENASAENSIISLGATAEGVSTELPTRLKVLSGYYRGGFGIEDDLPATTISETRFYWSTFYYNRLFDSLGEDEEFTAPYSFSGGNIINFGENESMVSKNGEVIISGYDDKEGDVDVKFSLSFRKSASLDNSSLAGVYRFYDINKENDTEGSPVEGELTLNGDGTGTYELISPSGVAGTTGNVNYVVVTDGALTITVEPGEPDESVFNGFISSDGERIAVFDTDYSDNDVEYFIAVKESTSMQTSDVSGYYNFACYSDDNNDSNITFTQFDVYLDNDNSFSTVINGQINDDGTTYAVSSDGTIVVTEQSGDGMRGIVSSDGNFIIMMGVDTDGGMIPPAVGDISAQVCLMVRSN